VALERLPQAVNEDHPPSRAPATDTVSEQTQGIRAKHPPVEIGLLRAPVFPPFRRRLFGGAPNEGNFQV